MSEEKNTQNKELEQQQVTINEALKELSESQFKSLNYLVKSNKPKAFKEELIKVFEKNDRFLKKLELHFKKGFNVSPEEVLEKLKNAFDVINKVNRINKNDFKKGDLVSYETDKKEYIKGVVKEVKEKTLIINNYSKGLVEIPKNNTAIFFPGQKYDYREIQKLFPKGNVNYLDFGKSERLKLLAGKETKPVLINYYKEYKNEAGETVKKFVEEKVKFQIGKNYKTGNLEIKVIKAFGNKIYNKELSNDEIEKLKSGEVIKTTISKSNGEKFDTLLFWDKELEGVRAKAPNKKPKQSLTYAGVQLDKKQLDDLNSGKDVLIQNKETNQSYKLKYYLELDKLVAEKIKNQDLGKDTDGDGITDVQEESLGTNKYSADSDSDGFSDSEEIAKNTNPLDDNSKPGKTVKADKKVNTANNKKVTNKQTTQTNKRKSRKRKL